jgi:Glyoxalase-like domain
MDIDHIFIFSDEKGTVADQLVSFGLTEGTGRVHQGQGTSNRIFYFDNFFLEIVWVHNEDEINSLLVKPTGLWQRAGFKETGYSPFGLGLVNTDQTDKLFDHEFKYQPDYFPEGMVIDIIKNENQRDLPWTFRLPFKERKPVKKEPVDHKNGIRRLTKTTFYYQSGINDDFIKSFANEQSITFIQSDKTWLTLSFDHKRLGLQRHFETLFLTIEY